MNVTDIQTLYAYNLWATQRMFTALEKLSDEQFGAPVQSSFPSIRESVVHILAAEWLWLRRWKGVSPQATGPYTSSTLENTLRSYGVAADALSTLPGLRKFAGSIEQERQELLDNLTDDALHAPLTFNGMDGAEYSMPLLQLMQHVVNHGTYHRGQVTTLLRQAGAESAALDMTFFFRESEQRATASH